MMHLESVPQAWPSHLIEQGSLRALVTDPELPSVCYAALHQVDASLD